MCDQRLKGKVHPAPNRAGSTHTLTSVSSLSLASLAILSPSLESYLGRAARWPIAAAAPR